MGFSRRLKRGFLLEREDEALVKELARRAVKRSIPLWGLFKELEREVLERALDEYGGSPTQVADALALHKSFVCRWKRGRPNV